MGSDAKFCSLPPPKPSRPRRHPSSGSTSVSMRSYMNARAICFAGECQVTMADGSRQRVDAVRKGDKVMMPNGNPAAVQCIVVTPFEKGHADLVCLDSGLIITPFHPIWPRGASRWTFPAELAEPQQIKCPAVYSFVLSDGGSCLLVNDTPAVSLGHELKDSPAWVTTSAWSGLTTVAEHQFFGTKAVITELKMLHGWHKDESSSRAVAPPSVDPVDKAAATMVELLPSLKPQCDQFQKLSSVAQDLYITVYIKSLIPAKK